MKIYKLSIKPKSTFFTYPKGDMIYGFFLYWWDKLKKGKIEDIIDKVVFSDFLPDGYFPKPAFEYTRFTDDENKRKEIKSIDWIKEDDLINGKLKNIVNEGDFEFIKKRKSVKNHLNKISLTTSENFSPYVVEEIDFLYPVVMYIASEDIESVAKFLDEIGSFGFGKRSSVGKGVFEVLDFKEYLLIEANNYLSISPFLTTKKAKYNLFTRYGKFYGSAKPFKNPVVLMDSGSVVLEECNRVEGRILEDKLNKSYFIQAKSIMIPFKDKK
jgi:CRISPR-associated protein Csm4